MRHPHAHAVELLKLVARSGGRYLPAAYELTANVNGGQTRGTYALVTQTGRGPFVCLGIERPSARAWVEIHARGAELTAGEVWAAHIMDNVSDEAEARLPAPIVVSSGGQLRVKARGTAGDLSTANLKCYGFHTSPAAAAAIGQAGELFAVTLDTGEQNAVGTFTRKDHTFKARANLTHALETENGNAESGLTVDEIYAQIGEVQLHPDGNGLLPSRPQKAGTFLGMLRVDAGTVASLKGRLAGSGTGRVQLTLAGSQVVA